MPALLIALAGGLVIGLTVDPFPLALALSLAWGVVSGLLFSDR